MRLLARASIFGIVFGFASSSGAQSDAEVARRAKVAARVGPRTVSVGDLEDRLAGIPSFQLATFGASREEVIRAYVDQVVVRDLMLASAAEERKLETQLPTSFQLKRALSNASLRASHAGIPAAAAISAADVQQYYDENRSRYDSPERVNLWRILCKTAEEASTVLDAAKREPTIAKFNELARDKSIDKATNLRGGNLGFVSPDGTSNEAGLKVEPSLVRAAATVKDGDFVAQPVGEGGNFAVVWRRATVPAARRSVEEASAQIRTALFRERIEAAEKGLAKDLRAKYVREVDYGLLGLIELPPFDAGTLVPRSNATRGANGPR